MGSSEGALHSVVMESEKFGYNGRRDRTDTDRYYSDEYADKIVKRAKDPNAFVPIEIKLAK